MGGRGSGGSRPGSGRKPKDRQEAWLGGDAGKRRGKDKPPPVKPFALIPAPVGLPDAQRDVWNELAPHACAARTLVEGTVEAFIQLCQRIVLMRLMAAQIEEDGLMDTKVSLQMDEQGGGLQTVQKKSHDLLTKYMTVMQRVDPGMLRFRLSPMGKELTPVEPPTDEWAEFEGAVN